MSRPSRPRPRRPVDPSPGSRPSMQTEKEVSQMRAMVQRCPTGGGAPARPRAQQPHLTCERSLRCPPKERAAVATAAPNTPLIGRSSNKPIAPPPTPPGKRPSHPPLSNPPAFTPTDGNCRGSISLGHGGRARVRKRCTAERRRRTLSRPTDGRPVLAHFSRNGIPAVCGAPQVPACWTHFYPVHRDTAGGLIGRPNPTRRALSAGCSAPWGSPDAWL